MSAADGEKNGPPFPFPFRPYAIQLELMTQIYGVLAKGDGHVGVFESPTGTGKSLSVFCSTMKWLRDQETVLLSVIEEKKRKKIKDAEALKALANEPDWVAEHVVQQQSFKIKLLEEKQRKLTARLDKARIRMQRSDGSRPLKAPRITSIFAAGADPSVNKKKAESKKGRNKKKRSATNDGDEDGNAVVAAGSADIANNLTLEALNAFDEWDSDAEAKGRRGEEIRIGKIGGSAGNDDDDDGDGDGDDDDDDDDRSSGGDDDDDEEPLDLLKIIYCSRTHSQLSQFVGEVHKTVYNVDARVVTLASRKNMCVNEAVNKASKLSTINDQCLDLMEKKKKTPTAGCPYLHRNVSVLRDKLLLKVQDIEDAVAAGSALRCCPYYAARQASVYAEVLAVPYQALLHKGTRESLNIRLAGNIVVIDEAHNLVDAINAIHTIDITLQQFEQGLQQLEHYRKRFREKLKAQNLKYVSQCMELLRCICKYINNPDTFGVGGGGGGGVVVTIHEFSEKAKICDFNLYKICNYIEASGIAKKLHYANLSLINNNGYSSNNNNNSSTTTANPATTTGGAAAKTTAASDRPPLEVFYNFLTAINTSDANGRIMVTKSTALKFINLNPHTHFAEVLQQARAVVLVGGTMHPISDLVKQLFAEQQAAGKLTIASFGHVIPKDNLLVGVVCCGPNNMQLKIDYTNRSDDPLIDTIAASLRNIIGMTPGGVVVFFPSYGYLDTVRSRWETRGLASKLAQIKPLVWDSQDSDAFASYTALVSQNKTVGAVLLSVVGGRMSEGINFSDELGRCVVMVGLPYANSRDPILKARMDFLNETGREGDGNEFYENLCMRAVNQSVGRAIRHANDFAAIILLDARFARPNTQAKLPQWLQTSVKVYEGFGPLVVDLRHFFSTKNTIK